MLDVRVLLLLVKIILFHSAYLEQVADGLQAEVCEEFLGQFALEEIDKRPCVRMHVLLLSIAEQALDDFLLADLAFD